MLRIDGQLADEKDLAHQVLSWIICAKRPLSLVELEHAIAVENGDSELDLDNICPAHQMVSTCVGLITIDEESSVVRLVHYTAQEYFERTRDKWFSDAEAQIAKSCITYLSFKAFQSGPCKSNSELSERLASNKFYGYAARYWGYHASKASTLHRDVIMGFLGCAHNFQASVELLHSDTEAGPIDRPGPMPALHVVAFFGIQVAVDSLLDLNDVPIDFPDRRGRTPLMLAALGGHTLIVKQLLDRAANPNEFDFRHESAIFYAVRGGNTEVITLLVDRGSRLRSRSLWGFSPLHLAIGLGLLSIVNTLLDEGADVSQSDGYGKIPLFIAVQNNDEAMVKLLLDRYTESLYPEVSSSAICSSITMTLEYKAGQNIPYNTGGSILCHSIRSSMRLPNYAITRLLLENGFPPNDEDEFGDTPLLLAAQKGDLGLIELLLTHGANMNADYENDHTLLWLAYVEGNGKTDLLLAERGVSTPTDFLGLQALFESPE